MSKFYRLTECEGNKMGLMAFNCDTNSLFKYENITYMLI